MRVPAAVSSSTPMSWSSCLLPVPPSLKVPGGAARKASSRSLAVLCGDAALTHSTNWSSASICTGVMSRQLKSTPVASGAVNRFDSVITSLCGLPLLALMSIRPSMPELPALLTTLIGWRSSCLLAASWAMKRAIWSAPPPVPAGTTSSTGAVGSQARAGVAARAATSDQAQRRSGWRRRAKRWCSGIGRVSVSGSGWRSVPRGGAAGAPVSAHCSRPVGGQAQQTTKRPSPAALRGCRWRAVRQTRQRSRSCGRTPRPGGAGCHRRPSPAW